MSKEALCLSLQSTEMIINPQSRKIKVLHLITDLDPGGAEIMLFKLLSAMNRDIFDNLVVSMTDIGPIGKKIEKLAVPVWSLKMRRGVPSWKGLKTYWGILARNKPDIIQTWMYHADLLGALAGKNKRTSKLIWNIRCSNMDFSHYRRLTFWVVKLCAWFSSFPDAVIVNSKQGQEHHHELGYHPKRWELIPNGFDLQNFIIDPQARREVRQELGLEENSILIGMIARFDPMKDHQVFLAAATQLVHENTAIFFLLVGEGVTVENSLFRSYLNKDQLGGRLFLLGYRDDVAKLNASLDLATSSSCGEGFPNAIGEAMACGVPCVVTDTGDSAYLVGETGISVPPRDPEALAEGWVRLIDMKETGRKALGMAARERIDRFFSIGKVAAQYEALYRRILSGVRS
ncbi:MAG: glycosyltransferase [Pseudomonadota bacterium]